jgi:hypothetical protein
MNGAFRRISLGNSGISDNSDKFCFILKISEMTVTTVDYLKAIKQHLHLAKQSDPTGILHKPTPAQLRNYCLLLLENGLKPNDEIVFRHFFQIKKEEDLRKTILQCDVDRLKAIQKFIDGSIESPNSTNLELIAVLINFEHRPYSLFSKKGHSSINNKEDETIIEKQETTKEDKKVGKNNHQKIIIGTLLILVIACFVFTIKTYCFHTKECMQWNRDHYEQVECNCDKSNNSNEVKVIDYDEIKLKKITLNKSTVFFKNGKPVVWYCKINGCLECYSSHGYHPITGKPLKPITKYMIHKYLNF